MKWFKNVEILKEMLENNEERLEEVEYDSEIWNLLTDENSLIKHHLELIKENQELKKPKFDLSLLDNAKKIEVNYNEELLKQIETIKQKNQELKDKIIKEMNYAKERMVFYENEGMEDMKAYFNDEYCALREVLDKV